MAYVNITEKRVQIKNTHNQFFGGFITYFKLVIQIWKQSFFVSSNLTSWKKLWFYFSLVIKTPYWLFIKPWMSAFSLKTSYSGTYLLRNDRLVEDNITKVITLRLIRIPFFMYPSRMNENDWAYLLKKMKNSHHTRWLFSFN